MVKNVRVYLDNEQREYMNKVRCGFIVAEDEKGEETFHTNLIDSSEYDSVQDLLDDIVGIFKVRRETILVTA